MTNAQAGFCIMLMGIIFIIVAIVITIYDKLRYRKYDEIVKGTVIGHKVKHLNDISYPIAIVEYHVNGQTYQVKQDYNMIYYNNRKHAEYDWEIDDKYRLHRYVTKKCKYHINPTVDWFPVGSKMDVHYNTKKPQKAYCGSLTSMFLFQIILFLSGIFISAFGLLLMTVLK